MVFRRPIRCLQQEASELLSQVHITPSSFEFFRCRTSTISIGAPKSAYRALRVALNPTSRSRCSPHRCCLRVSTEVLYESRKSIGSIMPLSMLFAPLGTSSSHSKSGRLTRWLMQQDTKDQIQDNPCALPMPTTHPRSNQTPINAHVWSPFADLYNSVGTRL